MKDEAPDPPLQREGEPTMAQLLDPVAWERRLQEARARRAEALADRENANKGAPARPPAPRRAVGPATSPALGASAGPALSPWSRPGPATGPAVAERAGPSLRELAAQSAERSAQPTDPKPAAGHAAPGWRNPVPAGQPATRFPFAARPASPFSEAARPQDRPAEPAAAAAASPPSHAGGERFRTANSEVTARVHEPREKQAEADALAPLPGEAEPEAPSAGATDRLAIPPLEDADHAEPLEDRRPPAFIALPPRTAATRAAAGWFRPRVALLAAAGLGLGLAGALALTGPVLEHVEEVALLRPGTDPAPEAAGSAPAPAPEADAAVSTAPPAPGEEQTAAAEPAPDSPPATGDLATLEESWEPAAAPAGELDLPLGARPAERPDLAALAPPAAEPALPQPAPTAALPTPDPADAPLLAEPATMPRPDLPTPIEAARAPSAPDLPPAPEAGSTPAPAAVARTPLSEPGILTAGRPPARPASLTSAAAPAEEPVDFAALTPAVPAADDGVAADESATAATPPDRLLVHVPSALSASEADDAIAALGGAGFEPAARIDVQIPIGSTNIRYYFPEDAAAARAMADAITARTGQAAEARDFTGFRPRPAPGTVEVWLAGQPRPEPQPQRVASPPPAAAPAQPRVARPQPPVPAQPRVVQSQPQMPAPVATRRPPPPARSPADAAMRDLELLADEIARAISRSLND